MSKQPEALKQSNLHGEIMNLPCDKEMLPWSNTREAYMHGHRDARHAAAELANAADAEIERLQAEHDALLSALIGLEAMAESYRYPGQSMPDAQKIARIAISTATGAAA